jgi:hypothetical protein
MRDPNSLIVRFRRWLARAIDVKPDAGEGWCLGCCLNGGRTKVIPGEGLRDHVDLHSSGDYVHIETTRKDLPEEMPL